MMWQRPSDQSCPKCGNFLLEKGNKLVCADASCGFKKEKEAVSEEEKK